MFKGVLWGFIKGLWGFIGFMRVYGFYEGLWGFERFGNFLAGKVGGMVYEKI